MITISSVRKSASIKFYTKCQNWSEVFLLSQKCRQNLIQKYSSKNDHFRYRWDSKNANKLTASCKYTVGLRNKIHAIKGEQCHLTNRSSIIKGSQLAKYDTHKRRFFLFHFFSIEIIISKCITLFRIESNINTINLSSHFTRCIHICYRKSLLYFTQLNLDISSSNYIAMEKA